MIIRLFKTTQPFALAILGIVAIIMWMISWNLHFRLVEPNGMPLYDLLLYLMKGMPAFSFAILGWLLISTQAIHFNYVLNKHEVLYRASWLPALIYIIIVSLLPPFLWFHPLLIVNTILIFALDKIFMLYKNPSPLSLDFNSCFLLAIASLFYLPAVVLFFIYALGIIILRPFSWRDWIVGILGFILPFFLAFLYYFLKNELNDFYSRVFITGISKQLDLKHFFTYQYTYSVAIIGFLFVMSLIRLQSNYYKNVTKARLIQQLLLMLIVVGSFSVLVSRDEQLYRFNILALPLSAYISYYFLSGKKLWLMELVFLVLVGSWVWNYFFA